jgi:hypothetical protein
MKANGSVGDEGQKNSLLFEMKLVSFVDILLGRDVP